MLRRTADDTDPTERVVVANADQLLIVVALADPPPRTGFVERALIAAYAGGLAPILCLTKTDLAPPEPFAAQFADLDLTIATAGRDDPLDAVAPLLVDKVTVLLGHSGVGKSTLVNRLVPEADRAIGDVTAVGKGRHTSTQSVALPLEGCGWVIDTPGIRSFGLAHIEPDDVLLAFSDLAECDQGLPAGLRTPRPARRPRVRAGHADRPGRGPGRRGAATVGGAERSLTPPRLPGDCWSRRNLDLLAASEETPSQHNEALPDFGEGLGQGAYQLPFRALMCQMPWWLCQPGFASAAGSALTLGAYEWPGPLGSVGVAALAMPARPRAAPPTALPPTNRRTR